MLRSNVGPDGRIEYVVEYTLALTSNQARVLGPDAVLLARHLDTLLAGLAALRSGVWSAGTKAAREPEIEDWASVISAAEALGELGQAVMAGAVREHAELGGTTEQLGEAMNRPTGTAQNRRQKWIGTRGQPVAPAGPEEWARTGGQPPA